MRAPAVRLASSYASSKPDGSSEQPGVRVITLNGVTFYADDGTGRYRASRGGSTLFAQARDMASPNSAAGPRRVAASGVSSTSEALEPPSSPETTASKANIMPDWMVTCYKQSPPSLLAFLALLGILGWSELKSVDGHVGDVSKTLSQTREQMIEGLGNLKT